MMKKLALLVLMTLIIQKSYAANPDQDLIVDLARERFTAAAKPSSKDLAVGKQWNCVIYNARRGYIPNYNQKRVIFEFTAGDTANTFMNDKSGDYRLFKYQDNSLASVVDDAALFVRVDGNHHLTFETTGPQPEMHKAYRSIANPKLRAYEYGYCDLVN